MKSRWPIVELDARPSDSIALAVRQQAPIYVVKEVWDVLKDMTSVLEELRDKGMEMMELIPEEAVVLALFFSCPVGECLRVRVICSP